MFRPVASESAAICSCGIAVGGQLGDLEVAEQPELLQTPDAAADQRQHVHGDLSVDDGDPVDEPVALEQLHRPGVGALDDLLEHVLHVGVGEQLGDPTLDRRLGAGGQHRFQPCQRGREDRVEHGVDVDRGEDLLGDVVGERCLGLRLGERFADDAGHPVAVERRRSGPDGDRRDHEDEDRQHAEDAGGDAPPASSAGLLGLFGLRFRRRRLFGLGFGRLRHVAILTHPPTRGRRSPATSERRTYDPPMPRPVSDDMPDGLQLFASAQDEPRARRPTDVALAIIGFLLVVVTATLSEVGGDLDAEFADLLESFPSFFDPLWLILGWTPVAWAGFLFVVALARRRIALARDLLAGAVLGMVVAVFVAWVVGEGAWDPIVLFADVDGPPTVPPGALTFAAAVISTASPHLSRPFRHFGRWIVAGQFIATMFLGATFLERQRRSPSRSASSPPPSSTSSSARPAGGRRRRGSSSPFAGSASMSSS